MGGLPGSPRAHPLPLPGDRARPPLPFPNVRHDIVSKTTSGADSDAEQDALFSQGYFAPDKIVTEVDRSADGQRRGEPSSCVQ